MVEIVREKKNDKRFAAHVLMFDCEQFILHMIDNCAPFVEKIYVAYSEVPWTYNTKSRITYTNSTQKDILSKSKYFNKIELIEGSWDTEEDQRNTCLLKAQKEGFDYLITQDADEFYRKEDYKKNLDEIIANPTHDVYITPWYVFWKSSDYVIQYQNGNITDYNVGFAINCKSEVKFTSRRMSNAKASYKLSGVCYHLAYVLTDEQVYRKISTWGHSHQFNRDSWYYRKWLHWNESTRNLHPLTPYYWKCAVKFKGDIPEVLAEFKSSDIRMIKNNLFDNIWDFVEDTKSHSIGFLRTIKIITKKVFKFQ